MYVCMYVCVVLDAGNYEGAYTPWRLPRPKWSAFRGTVCAIAMMYVSSFCANVCMYVCMYVCMGGVRGELRSGLDSVPQ